MNPQLYDDCVHFCWKCKKVGMLLDIGDQWEGTMTHKDCGGLTKAERFWLNLKTTSL